MSYIEFDKEQLVNINFSKSREILRCSHTGAFANTTLVGLNTRKYHGLFIAPQDRIDHERHVLVSNLNETIIVNNMDFHLSMNQFKGGIINPKGNKYLQQFTADGIPTYLYRVGKFNFTKEIIFLKNSDRLIIKYTMLDNYDSASFQFQPLLAFRSIHQLTHANDQVNTQFESVENGVGFCLYDNYTPVYLQCSSPITYQHHPDWFYNVEYEEELNRGYEGVEDLYTPGSFTAEVKDKELFITIGTEPIKTENIAKLYTDDIKQHTSRSSFFNCLQNAADQFIVKRNGKTEVIAGYPWFGRWGRDTFIALPGLTLALGKHELCKEIMDSMIEDMNEGLFPNIGSGANAAYNSVDAPLWFFRTLQLYAQITHTEKKIWKEYGETMKRILSAYRHGTLNNIRMLDNGLIYAGGPGLALTWMDAVIDGRPVTPRTGCQVEINALWYNAVKFALEMARLAKDSDFIYDWEPMVQDFPTVFKDTFWSKEIGYLADYVNGDYKNFQIRPNMMIATSLPYSPISEKIRQLILKRTCEELLTDKGIRSLSPNDPEYKGHYFGNQAARDAAYHQGTCWIWLLFPFTDGMLAVYQKSAIPVLQRILYKFDNCMTSYGISTIAEITDGDPPHKPNGCISQAWSVAALLYMKWRIEHY
ncbi:MAG: glycogen debranching enzyme family protein [Bacteroidales bacterium]|nr:glycogen debranching enzyme family protein [Bacteroidales bacterium]